MLRIDALRLHVLDKPDLEKAQLLVADIESIKRQFPKNLMVLTLSTSVHTVAYHVFGDLQQPVLQKAALEEGKNDMQALATFASSLKAKLRCWIFFDETAGTAWCC